ncbi:MAG TPA: AMP-binding protein [Bryobacteraceae bacterium]|nr:AMP-binding protein [Bryobacteraceae bacterium]
MFLNPNHSGRPAVFDSNTRRWWTYQELGAQVRQIAQHLAGPRRLAFCFCRNDAATIANYLACLESGHPVALLDPAMALEAKQDLLALYQPELILASASDSCVPTGYPVSTCGTNQIWRAKESPGPPLNSELAVLLSTSGTTGSPRFVRLSARNIRSNAESIIAALGIVAEDRAIASLPFHYSYGLSVLNTHLLAGASLVTTADGIVSQRFWADVREQNCTSFAGVPYSYQVLDRLRLDTLNVPELRTLTQAGGKLDVKLISRFHELMQIRGGRFFVMYGQTEATARIAILPASELPRKLGSAGLPITGGCFEIKGNDGSGELVYHGPNVMMGYATNRADLEQGDRLHGTLETGDLCRIDDEGFLFVIGRLKRDAKVFGLRINLDEVEAMLKTHGPTAVISASDKLLVFCEYGDDGFLHSLQHQIAARLNINHLAFEFRRLDALPLQQNGKIDYAALQGMRR